MSLPPPIHQVIFNGSAVDVGTSPSTITIDDPTNKVSFTSAGGKDCMQIDSDGTHPDIYVPCVFDHTQSFTFSIWVKFNNVAAWNVPFLLVGGDVNIMCAFNATQMFLSVGNGVNQCYDQTNNGGKNFLEWSCITFFYNASNGLFFGGVNGTIDIGLNIGGHSFTTSHFLIGGEYQYETLCLGGQVSWNGYVRQLNIFDYALTDSQMTQLYNSTGGNEVLYTPPSPVLLLKASGYTSGEWLDQSTSGNNASLENGTAILNAAGNGFVLDGQTSFTCPNLSLGNAWTVNVWYKQVGPLTGYHSIISQTYGNYVNMFIALAPGSTNVSGGFLTNNWNTGSPITLPNEWTNIQVTWDGINMKTYILGSLTSSVQINYPSNDNQQLYTIGRCDWGAPGYMTGELGEVRVYNTPLTQAQVTADFQESLATFINTSAPYNITTSIGGNYFTARWLGGTGATSYTYTLNGSPVTPSTDNGLTSQSATFTGLTPETNYVLAIVPNSNDSLSVSTSIKTLVPPVHQLVLKNSKRDYGSLASIVTQKGNFTYTNNSGMDSLHIDSDGINTYMTIPYVVTEASSFTISAWVKTDSDAWTAPICLEDGTNNILSIGILSSAIYITGQGSSQSTGLIPGFNHVCITYTPSQFNVYLNKILVINMPISSAFTSKEINIGGTRPYTELTLGPNLCNAYVRQLCVFDRELNAESITRLYATTQDNTILVIPSDPLTPYAVDTTVTKTSLTASWVGGTGATSYTYTLNGSSVTPVDNGLSSQEVTFTGLSPSTEYTLVITAVNSPDSQSVTKVVTTLTDPPTTPIVSISNITYNSFTASWTGADRATSYTYTINDSAFTPDTVNIITKTATFSGLNDQVLYSLVVRAINSGGSAESTIVSVTTLVPPPSKPQPVNFYNITLYGFAAIWGSSGATSFTYTINEQAVTPSTDNGISGLNATFSGLTPNTEYRFVVTAINDYGQTSSDVATFTTADPVTPYELSVTHADATSFTISWLGGIGATSYSYAIIKNPNVPTVIDNGVSSKSVTFTGLSPSSVYCVQIVASNSTNLRSGVNSICASTTAALTKLLLLKAVDYRSGAWQDESKNANNATLENGTARKNTRGNGIVLDGQTSWTFPNLDLGNAWTVAVWYKETEAVSGASILTQMPGATNGGTGGALEGGGPPPQYINASIAYNANGSVVAGFRNDSWYTGAAVTLYGWTNIQATWDGTTLNTYVNATLDSQQTGGTAISSNLAYLIGSDGTTFAKGEIGEVRVYNLPLTEEQVTADYTASLNNFATPIPGVPPSAVANLTTNTVTGNSFGASWTGGFGATSYTYTLNGSPAVPTFDKALNGQTVLFTGLTPSTPYTLVVKAVNENGQPSASVSVTTLSPPPPPTVEEVAAVQNTFTAVSTPAAAATAIEAALAANVAPQTLVAAALAVATPAMFTALVSSPAFIGTTVSVPPAAAAALYAAFAPTVTVDTSLPLEVNFPAADGSVKPPAAGSNSKLAIDLTRDTFVPFNGATGYGINVTGGVQYFVTPTNPGTLVHVGDPVTFTLDGGAAITFVVADLDIVFAPYTAPPPVVVCFLVSAPVLTPSGYRRIDRLAVGDVVKTPTGTAFVEAIKKNAYTPGPATNPYVIPEGMFGANRKLHISPRHKVLVNGEMVEARHLGLQQDVHKNPIIYYNIQITKAQNMIVAGVEVESLKPLVRITISREAFNYILATQHGGQMTPEIRSKCHFLADGRVSVPSIKR